MAVAAIIAGAAMSAASMVQQGRIAKAQGKADEKIAQYNAKQADRMAQAKMDAAKIESDRMSRNQKIVQATNRAMAAKSGISLSESPSTIAAMADVAYQFHLDRNFILNQGMQDYVSTKSQASLLRAEGAFAKTQGRAAAMGYYMGAGGSALQGAGTAAYYNSLPKTPPGSISSGGTYINSSDTFNNMYSRPISSYPGR